MQFIKAMDLQEVYANTYAAKIQALVKTPRRKKNPSVYKTYHMHSIPNRFKQ